MSQPHIILIDGNNGLYRFYHTRPPLVKNGARVETAISFVNNVRRYAEGAIIGEAEQVITVYDADGPTFRHEMTDAYKADREGMPDELASQELLSKEMLSALGFAWLEKKGIEADDTLGMLANHYANQGYRVSIVTSDKDMHQLIDENISIYNAQAKVMRNRQETIDKFGVPPEHIAELLALQGDGIDGIDGVPGVGPKTAAEWLNEYGSLQAVVDNAHEIKGRGAKGLRETLDEIPLYLKLTQLRDDPVFLTEDDLYLVENTARNPALIKVIETRYDIYIDKGPAPTKKKIASPPKAPEPEETQGSLF
ncbi:5'-3' exonuclease [Neptuniibacter sp. QD37_11]|uniref:5'-3' exonuclease n=1 Tax=Neptuniibacter sp. QD37_11 TaxID=3398209 RepID=UPI0039F5FE26